MFRVPGAHLNEKMAIGSEPGTTMLYDGGCTAAVFETGESRLRNRILLLLLFCGLVASASAQSNFNRFNFTVGYGPSIGRTYVSAFVGNSYDGVVGGGWNFSRMFGVDAEYMYYGLPIRQSVINSQSLPGASGNLQSVSLNGILNAPLHSKLGAYGIFGIGFYRRSVSATPDPLPAGATCQQAWVRWWGIACNTDIPPKTTTAQTLSSLSKDAGGFNVGGGVSYRLNHLYHAKVFLEARYHRAYQSDAQTSVIPITLGLRW
jgi:Outer membrane protein beta-barrel domain